MNPNAVVRLIAPLARRVRLMVGRCVLEAVDDSTKMQAVKVHVLEGVVRDEVEHFQPGGITHVAPKGAEALLLSVGGTSDHGIAILASDRTKRPMGLQPGETKVYAVDGGYLFLQQDGSASLVPVGSGLVHLGAESAAEFAAVASKTDNRISALENSHNTLVTAFNAFVTIFNAHQHLEGAPYQVAPPPATPNSTQPPASPASPGTLHTAGPSVAASKVKVE